MKQFSTMFKQGEPKSNTLTNMIEPKSKWLMVNYDKGTKSVQLLPLGQPWKLGITTKATMSTRIITSNMVDKYANYINHDNKVCFPCQQGMPTK